MTLRSVLAIVAIGLIICLPPFYLVALVRQEIKVDPKAPAKQEKKDSQTTPTPDPKTQRFDPANPTAEQIAETVVFVYSPGGRPMLAQIRKNGIERGKWIRILNDGRTEETTYERRFIRGDSTEKDKVRLDQRTPSLEYSLVFDGAKTFGVLNGAVFTPRDETAKEFHGLMWRGIETLLRHKEDGSTVKYVGKDKQKGLEYWMLDLTDKQNRTTRFYISTRSGRVLWLEYEDSPGASGTTIKYMKRFQDYRSAQGTLVPYQTIVFEDGKQTQESRIMTITYGGKIDESLFQSPDTTR